MKSVTKTKKRGFVMTGGGAKGLYEAGVIHAFHLTGMEFDIITGSSIGAMNSIFYAEYLFHKRSLPQEILQDPLKTIDKLDDRVRAFHHAWLLMPDKRVIDDSEAGPIGQLKNDLLKFNLSLPQLVSLGWWWTDPDRNSIPSPKVWPSLMKLLPELSERLGGPGKVLSLLKAGKANFINQATRIYLRRFGLERSLVPSGSGDNIIRDIFTEPVTPLIPKHLEGKMTLPEDQIAATYRLVEPARSLQEYAAKGISVRLTRANYRTGRLEISTYLTPEEFIRYMDRQAWRVETADPRTLPLGSFRLQMPGNPSAINAALASGRFPGVFSPYPIQEIYPASDPENKLLYQMFTNWLEDPKSEASLEQAYQALWMSTSSEKSSRKLKSWEKLLSGWKKSKNMRAIFPRTTDTYVDGGAIDNTPSNSAIDAAREWADLSGTSKRDSLLELFVIFLSPEPHIDPKDVEDDSLIDVVKRTLEIVGAAKESSEAVTLDTINTFGQRGENLGRALQILIDSYQESLEKLAPADRKEAQEGLVARARDLGQRGYLGSGAEGILDRMQQWADGAINSLPMHVEEVRIYPEEMPLSTLQFTERMGYKQENALKMLTMGCYNTLWSLRSHLEKASNGFDDQDNRALGLARRWMGSQEWPEKFEEQQELQQNWRCTREACIYHAKECLHGASLDPQPKTKNES